MQLEEVGANMKHTYLVLFIHEKKTPQETEGKHLAGIDIRHSIDLVVHFVLCRIFHLQPAVRHSPALPRPVCQVLVPRGGGLHQPA